LVTIRREQIGYSRLTLLSGQTLRGLAGSSAGLGAPKLSSRNDACGLPGIPEADFNLDEPVAAQARRNRECQFFVNDLKMCHLETLTAARNFAPCGKAGGTKLGPDDLAGFSTGNDDYLGLNTEHKYLLDA
jgi:hypothetical protein